MVHYRRKEANPACREECISYLPNHSRSTLELGNISGHVYFSKEETRKVAAGAAGAAAVGPFG